MFSEWRIYFIGFILFSNFDSTEYFVYKSSYFGIKSFETKNDGQNMGNVYKYE